MTFLNSKFFENWKKIKVILNSSLKIFIKNWQKIYLFVTQIRDALQNVDSNNVLVSYLFYFKNFKHKNF